jgi:two-component system OmpR family sensor kinase
MSLRGRVLAGLALIAGLLAVAAVVITRTTESHLVAQLDEQLVSAYEPVQGSKLDRPHEGGAETQSTTSSIVALSSVYVGFVAPTGIETLVAPNLSGASGTLPVIDAARATAMAGTNRAFTVGSSTGGLEYRVLATTDSRLGGVVVVALPLRDVENTVRQLVTLEVTATLSILGMLVLVGWWVVHLGVRPIKQMTATASSIAAGELSHRVPDGDPATEAGQLGVALNNMLGRIEDSFDQRTRSEQRLRQFVADASHELRTPVTTIRGYAELFRSGGLTKRADLKDAMRRTEQEATRMGALIDDLLQLARLDQGRTPEHLPVDLAAISEDAVRDARAVDPSRPIAAHAERPSVVLGDDAQIRQVVANLVGNALVHTPAGTPIDVWVSGSDHGAVLEVSDRGPGMSVEAASRAFERFYREDPSRSRHRGGSGLGLSIVKAAVDAHGGKVALRSVVGEGTTVRVELPV